MISAQKEHAVRRKHLDGDEESNDFDRIKASVDIIAEKHNVARERFGTPERVVRREFIEVLNTQNT